MAILASVVVGIVNVRSLAENARLVSRSHEVIAGARDLLSIVKDAETGQRGYLLSADEAYLEPYEDALRRFEPTVARLDSLTAGNSAQHALFMALRDSAEAKIAELKRTVALLKSGDRAAALAAVRTGSGKNVHGRRAQEHARPSARRRTRFSSGTTPICGRASRPHSDRWRLPP